ncbi:MAG TPA: hypothetical protein VM123_04760 [archaeon]|nr:hypothetical protein [archaeon]
MTKILQFLGGFILSFLLIVGLFTGIIWYTKEYTQPPQPGVNVDSLLAAGVLPDSLTIYDKERYLLSQQKAQMEKEQADIALKEQEVAKREAMLDDLRQQLAKASAEEDSIMNVRYADQAKLIENMKPVDAKGIMDQMPDYSAARILMKMRKREAGRVMNRMDPTKLVRVSQLMTMLKE